MKLKYFAVCVVASLVFPAARSAHAQDACTVGTGVDVATRVTFTPADDAWLVEYTLREPTRTLVFDRPRVADRARTWRTHDGQWATNSNGFATLTAETPRCRFVVEFATDPAPTEKEYELHLAWSDGSRILYTGGLRVHPVDAPGFDAVRQSWSFHAPAGVQIVSNESASVRDLDLGTSWNAGGTYIYFGRNTPAHAGGVSWLVDGGMPGWLVDVLQPDMARVTAAFRDSTGYELRDQPLVLFSYARPDRSGLSFGGGTLPGILQMHLEGAGWSARDPSSQRVWTELLSHELFHFWNGGLFRPRDSDAGDEWISEGGANYAGQRMAVHLGVLDDATLERRMIEAANACIVGSDGSRVLDAPARGAFAILYSCGQVIHFIVDRTAPSGFYGVMRAVFAGADSSAAYGTDDWLAAARAAEATDAAAFAERLLDVGIPMAQAGDAFAAALRSAGVNATVVPAESALLSSATRRAVGELPEQPRLLAPAPPVR